MPRVTKAQLQAENDQLRLRVNELEAQLADNQPQNPVQQQQELPLPVKDALTTIKEYLDSMMGHKVEPSLAAKIFARASAKGVNVRKDLGIWYSRKLERFGRGEPPQV